jgi:predicted TIM-barrel fold metal-dependent hydrolase
VIGCDCHVHVFGPRDRYPQIDTRAYTAGIASLDSLKRNAVPLGITRFVIVQATVNGTDNSCVLHTLDALDGNGRGVVVVDPATITPRELDDMQFQGARGLRINLYSDYHKADPERVGPRLEALVEIAPEGWHVEVIAPLHILAEAASVLAASRVPLVIDHYGLPGGEMPDSRNGRVLLDLLRLPHVWMKLSGPYRALETASGWDPLATTPPATWLKAFVETAPDRLVWGSDWPHTPAHEDSAAGDAADPFRPIDYGRMFGDFLMAVSEPRTLAAIVEANPARLYGFA